VSKDTLSTEVLDSSDVIHVLSSVYLNNYILKTMTGKGVAEKYDRTGAEERKTLRKKVGDKNACKRESRRSMPTQSWFLLATAGRILNSSYFLTCFVCQFIKEDM